MASEGDKYICDGVWLRCDKGATPGKLTVLPKTVTLYGQSWATQLDAVPLVNIYSSRSGMRIENMKFQA